MPLAFIGLADAVGQFCPVRHFPQFLNIDQSNDLPVFLALDGKKIFFTGGELFRFLLGKISGHARRTVLGQGLREVVFEPVVVDQHKITQTPSFLFMYGGHFKIAEVLGHG